MKDLIVPIVSVICMVIITTYGIHTIRKLVERFMDKVDRG